MACTLQHMSGPLHNNLWSGRSDTSDKDKRAATTRQWGVQNHFFGRGDIREVGRKLSSDLVYVRSPALTEVLLSNIDSLLSVHVLFLHVLLVFIHRLLPQRESQIHTIALIILFTIH